MTKKQFFHGLNDDELPIGIIWFKCPSSTSAIVYHRVNIFHSYCIHSYCIIPIVLHQSKKNVLANHSNKLKATKSNITKEERVALYNLKKDNYYMILTADKGVSLVIMDKDMYIEKCMILLSDQNVYQECKDLTKSIHNKVINQLSDLKTI